MKYAWILCILILLSGCTRTPPEKVEAPWNQEWATLRVGTGKVEDWKLLRKDALTDYQESYYMEWVSGEEHTDSNAAGEQLTGYDGEIHLLVYRTESAKEASQKADQLEALTKERYPDAKATTAVYAGQSFITRAQDVWACATGVRGKTVIRVDVAVFRTSGYDPARILSDFLMHLHEVQ